MKPTVLTLAAANLVALAYGQQGYVYPDILSLYSNVTELSGIYNFLEAYQDVAIQYAHYSNITIFTASNDALYTFMGSSSPFNKPNDRTILEAILQYHIIAGIYEDVPHIEFAQTLLAPDTFTNVTGGQFVGLNPPIMNGNFSCFSGLNQFANVIGGPIYFSGGVVYIIDRVFTVPMNITTTATTMNLTSVSGALNKTDLTVSLQPVWDVTIFAPSNAAFNAVGSAVGNMSVQDLTSLMQYHIMVNNKVYSTGFGNKTFGTALGKNISMTVRPDGTTFVNNARVIQKDILLENGVLHIIDEVMNPQNTSVKPTSTSGVIAFAGAHSTGQTPFTNIPLTTVTTTPSPLNTTHASATPPSTHGKSSVSGGVVAAIVLGILIGLAFIAGAIYFFCIRRGYGIKVSRRSIVISTPRPKSGMRYELPPDGGRVEKVELPASEKYTHFDDSTEGSETPEPPEISDDKKEVDQSPLSPHDGIWELSADNDVRQRIEKFLRPKSIKASPKL